MKKIILIVFLVLFVGVLFWLVDKRDKPVISNFEECVAAGNPVAESYPRQCRTSEGVNFVEDVGNEIEKSDLIRVDEPRPNTEIVSPLVIRGEARGSWFFEGDFPIRLYDENGRELAIAIASAKGEWMTEDFVPFEATLIFSPPTISNGSLVLQKDNPSGLPENDNELVIPVTFKTESMEVSLYYYNTIKDPDVSCGEDAVVPVVRVVPLSKTPIQDSIRLLLTGDLSDQERNVGYTTEFPLQGVELVGANLKNGLLTLELSDPLSRTSGGSCRVTLLRSQVEKTALQFEGVSQVKIMPEELFQP